MIVVNKQCCFLHLLYRSIIISEAMINNAILDKRTELKWFTIAIIFLTLYCGFLFGFRSVLEQLENGNQTILKPEPGQIIAIGFLILIYHLSYVGLYAFSGLGKMPGMMAALLAVSINLVLLYGFKIWFDAIAGNTFLFSSQKLPWYAEEKIKFIIANGPLLLFFISVFAFRLIAIVQRMSSVE
jgi:hypothetical protein